MLRGGVWMKKMLGLAMALAAIGGADALPFPASEPSPPLIPRARTPRMSKRRPASAKAKRKRKKRGWR